MSLSSNGHSLAMATKQLSRHWEETKQSWGDSRAQHFEDKYMAQLIAGVERALPVFEDLDKILNRARNDCE
jgi:hypothetical protein